MVLREHFDVILGQAPAMSCSGVVQVRRVVNNDGLLHETTTQWEEVGLLYVNIQGSCERKGGFNKGGCISFSVQAAFSQEDIIISTSFLTDCLTII